MSRFKPDIMGESQNRSVLVVGATGYLGAEICKQLVEQKWKVKGLVRSTSHPGKVNALHQTSVETLIGDIKDPASLKRALKGVEKVMSTVSSTSSRQPGDSIDSVDIQGQMNVVDAAKNAGVKHFVYISVIDLAGEFPLQSAKRLVEEHLKQSGMTYTILRPALFMNVWLSPHLGFDYQHSKATIYGEGENPISWIAVKDVASFAVASLSNPAARNRVLPLGGPEALSPLEVVKEFEHQTGMKYILDYIPVETLKARREAATDSLEQSFSGLMLGYANGCVVKMDGLLEKIPIGLSTVSDYAKQLTKVKGAVL